MYLIGTKYIFNMHLYPVGMLRFKQQRLKTSHFSKHYFAFLARKAKGHVIWILKKYIPTKTWRKISKLLHDKFPNPRGEGAVPQRFPRISPLLSAIFMYGVRKLSDARVLIMESNRQGTM